MLSSDKGALYIVSENIDLKRQTVSLPQGSILQFEGGMLSNGELVGNNSTIVAGRYEIFKSVSLSGNWALDGVPVEWFGAVANDSKEDCSRAINQAIVIGIKINTPALLASGTYYTKNTIALPEKGTLVGLSPSLTTICYYASASVGVYMHGEYGCIRNICVQEYRMERKGICIKVGDSNSKVGFRRGYIEDVKVIGGNRGLDLEYQWCNKINGINCRQNNIGIYANETTPYIENAVIESSHQYGVYSVGSGIKLYNAIIEGNKIGCILNGKNNVLNNCYFEGNSASYLDKKAAKKKNGTDVEGGNLYVGEENQVTSLLMIGCRIINMPKYNNTIRIDKCDNFTVIGCESMSCLETTRNCKINVADNSVRK